MAGHPGQQDSELARVNQALQAESAGRQRAEEALRESETRYRLLLEHAPAGIYELDLTNGRFTAVNDVLCEYTGYNRDEFLSLDPLDFLTEESQKRYLQRQARVLSGEEVSGTVEYTIKGNTTSMLYHTTASPYYRRTKAEVWFRTDEDARRAGFTAWAPRKRR